MPSNDPTQLTVTYDSLDEAAASIQSAAEKLRRQLEDVQAAVRKVADVWEGDAKQVYDQVQHTWDQRADNLQNVLLSIAAEVKVASGDYRASDKKAASFFS